MEIKTTATVLNIRRQPNGKIVGRVPKDTVIEAIEIDNGWVKFEYKGKIAYLSSQFTQNIDAKTSVQKGIVKPNLLNMRKKPGGKIIDRLRGNTVINIISDENGWIKTDSNGKIGYVSAQFIKKLEAGEGAFFYQSNKLKALDLKPEKQLSNEGSREAKVMAKTWNKYGNLLYAIAQKLEIEVASAIAVLAVESGGKGFGSDEKMIIRFENHLFYTYWGKANIGTYNKHFQYNKSKQWQGHKFRSEENSEWENFHGNQIKEWEAFEFAKSIDEKAAMFSISMGAPQVMGFNYKKLGYSDVTAMYNNFCSDIRFHIFGLFDFFNSRMIEALKNKDFTTFARYYNGAGQAERYGKVIENYYESFLGIK